MSDEEETLSVTDFEKVSEKFAALSREMFGAFLALEEATKNATQLAHDLAEAFKMLEEAKAKKSTNDTPDINNN